MEVHHPHHPTHKKKWSEYIIEFLMLFAAVTLGFFAENVREHKIMNERKDQNLFSILQDLKQDSIYLESTIKYSDDGIRYFQKLKAKLYEFHDNKLSENEFIKFTIDNIDSSFVNQTVFLNSSSYKNMIATGNLTYVESKDLKWKLSNYYETWNKRIEVNGDEIDNVNNYFYREHLPIRKTYFNNILESSNTDITKANYKSFYFDVKLIREKLIDENLIIQTNVILNKVEDYNRKIKIFKNFNDELLEILSKKDTH
jgi:Family of unknown function (DUF6090)